VNLDAVELRIALIDYFTILVLRCPLPDASESMHQFTKKKIADEMAGRWRLAGTPVVPEHPRDHGTRGSQT
jgi:hypothetical protein